MGFLVGDGIEAEATPGVATGEAPGGEPGAASGPVALDRLVAVDGTGWNEPARRRPPGTNALVEADAEEQDASGSTHLGHAGGRADAAAETETWPPTAVTNSSTSEFSSVHERAPAAGVAPTR